MSDNSSDYYRNRHPARIQDFIALIKILFPLRVSLFVFLRLFELFALIVLYQILLGDRYVVHFAPCLFTQKALIKGLQFPLYGLRLWRHILT